MQTARWRQLERNFNYKRGARFEITYFNHRAKRVKDGELIIVYWVLSVSCKFYYFSDLLMIHENFYPWIFSNS